jgi:hypothetical protein
MGRATPSQLSASTHSPPTRTIHANERRHERCIYATYAAIRYYYMLKLRSSNYVHAALTASTAPAP